jgi:hypothetical protein
MVSRAALRGLMLSVALLGGCGHHSHNEGTVATGTATRSESPGEHDPCSLLEPKEVEDVLGAPLASPPFLAEYSDGCAYRDGNFHNIVIQPYWDGAAAFRMFGAMQTLVDGHAKGLLKLVDGTEIAGEWDEARVIGCCTFMALRGDQAVSVDVTGTTTVAIPQAAKLADAALKRLDHPLPIDGGTGVKPAKEYAAAHRPKRVEACALLTRPEAEALIGPLTGDPKSQGDSCHYLRAGTFSEEDVLSVDWEGGLRSLRENSALWAGFDTAANPAWEASGIGNFPGYCAVKRDVLVCLHTMAVKQEQALVVLAKAMSKIS